MKFEKGEIAILVFSVHAGDTDVGKECEIVSTPDGTERRFHHAEDGECFAGGHEYIIHCPSGYWSCEERSLRKRPQQDDNLFTEWAKSHLITDLITDHITDIRPTERQVREGLKGILHPFGEKAGEKL